MSKGRRTVDPVTGGLTDIRPIEGFQGYGASEDGRIWSAWGMGASGFQGIWKRVLRPGSNVAGYQIVALHKDGTQHTKTVHRLVWEAFNGPMPDDMEVNHINGVKADNQLANLEMVTSSENKTHALITGLRVVASKLTPADVQKIRERLSLGESQSSIGRDFGVSQSCVSNILHGVTWAKDFKRGVA